MNRDGERRHVDPVLADTFAKKLLCDYLQLCQHHLIQLLKVDRRPELLKETGSSPFGLMRWLNKRDTVDILCSVCCCCRRRLMRMLFRMTMERAVA